MGPWNNRAGRNCPPELSSPAHPDPSHPSFYLVPSFQDTTPLYRRQEENLEMLAVKKSGSDKGSGHPKCTASKQGSQAKNEVQEKQVKQIQETDLKESKRMGSGEGGGWGGC